MRLDAVDLLNRAAEVAPQPAEKDGPDVRQAWARYFAAIALAADSAVRMMVSDRFGMTAEERSGKHPELGYLAMLAHGATSAAVPLLTDPAEHLELLWSLTPEAGALNGEWSEWLTERCVELGVNPAELDPFLQASDFDGPSRLAAAQG